MSPVRWKMSRTRHVPANAAAATRVSDHILDVPDYYYITVPKLIPCRSPLSDDDLNAELLKDSVVVPPQPPSYSH